MSIFTNLKPENKPILIASGFVLLILAVGTVYTLSTQGTAPLLQPKYLLQQLQTGSFLGIAAAGMSAHLAGVMAAGTHLPVLGVPMDGKLMGGLDALLSTCNMPKGIPVGTMSMGSHGAVNAALFAAAILALSDKELEQRLLAYRQAQTDAVPENPPTG